MLALGSRGSDTLKYREFIVTPYIPDWLRAFDGKAMLLLYAATDLYVRAIAKRSGNALII